MGLIKRFTITKEPEMRKTVKKIVQYQAPCVQEMVALMDCMKRHPGTGSDSSCMRQRQALDVCARTAKTPNVSETKSKFYYELERLGTALRRSGY